MNRKFKMGLFATTAFITVIGLGATVGRHHHGMCGQHKDGFNHCSFGHCEEKDKSCHARHDGTGTNSTEQPKSDSTGVAK